MKYGQLNELLTDDEYGLVRHDFGRKCGEFSEADHYPPVAVPAELVTRLGVMEMEEGDDPFMELPDRFADSIFIARFPNDKLYLVNTEGFSYCRYIVPCTVDL